MHSSIHDFTRFFFEDNLLFLLFVFFRWAKRGVGILHFNSAPVHRSYYLSTDCFYVEINIEGSTGRVAAAMIKHEDIQHTPNQQTSSPKNCPEMIDCLNKGQFSKFVDHLEGLMAIYDMPEASLQDKTQGWKALSSLENDILRIDNLQRQQPLFSEDVSTKINHGALGFVQPRAGGLPMKITFFMSAKDQIDMSTKKFKILNSDMINEHNIGLSGKSFSRNYEKFIWHIFTYIIILFFYVIFTIKKYLYSHTWT